MLAGKLQHASFGIPGGRGMFSPIQAAMVGDPDFINMTDALRLCLEDWHYFIHYLEKHPTHVYQLVQLFPDYIGFSDSCRLGTVGVWVSGQGKFSPFLWQFEFPHDI